MKRKIMCALLAAVLTATSFAAGGTAISAKASETTCKYPRNEEGFPDLQGQTITIWFNMTTANAQATSDMGEYQVIKDLEEKLNCNIEFIHPPVGQAQDNFSIMMADTTLPDMIFCNGIDAYYPGGVEMAYADGVLFDYTEYINAENTPNFYNMIENDAFLKKAVTDDEGRIIRLGSKICGSEEADLAFDGPLIRKDYLEATGLEVPTTIDEWTEMLAAMKANGVEYPLAFHNADNYGPMLNTSMFSSAYGISGQNFFIKEDGTVGYSPYEDSYKDFLAQLNAWYEAGYINPDFTTQNGDDIMSLAAADKTGAILTHLWTYGANYFVTTETPDPSKALIPAPAPVLNEGDTPAPLRASSRSLGDKKYITADAQDPEACIALLDALYLPEVNEAMAWGVEGVSYTKENDKISIIQIPSDAPKETLLQMVPQQWHTAEDTDLDFILTEKYNKGAQPDALKLWKEQGTENSISNFILFNTEESEIRASYRADVTTYVQEMTLKFILGEESLDNFAEYQQTLKDMHVEDLIAVYQSAMDRYNAR